MSRRVDADVVLAALHAIDEGLSARDVANGALRASNARHRVRSLVQQIENQAVTDESRVTHDSTLDGAGDLPAEGTILSDAAEFAAAWNALTVEQRAEWFVGWAKAMNDASRCVIANHDGLVHQHAALARAILKVRAGVLLDDMHEIDALPNMSVLVDRDGDVWQYRGGLWCSYETARHGSEFIARKYGPVKVIAIGDVS